jgi:hypothetical protein
LSRHSVPKAHALHHECLRIVAPIALARVPLIEWRPAGVGDGAKESKSCRPTSDLGGPGGMRGRRVCTG